MYLNISQHEHTDHQTQYEHTDHQTQHEHIDYQTQYEHTDGDGVTLKTPHPRGWVASARACGQKAGLESYLG